ncbi:mitochondrial carrier domain-containing protein [Spinellus fusiger]|nr:mitochondrial carrier domain-containing protein [Spinellus fusiger]
MTTEIAPSPTPVVPQTVKELVAGTVGGWAQVAVGHPFDTLKVRLQTQPSPPIYKNAMDCFHLLVKQEGFKGLYRGVASPLAGVGFCNAVVFMSNGEFRRLLQGGGPNKVLSLPQVGLAGSMAGTVMSFFNCPIELLKVKLQTQDPRGIIGISGQLEAPYKGVIDCGMRTVRDHGAKGIYRGLGITLLRDSPSYGFYFMTYEGLKRVFQSIKTDNAPLTTVELLVAGGLSGFGAWIPAYPQDVLKSCIQNEAKINSSFPP